MVSDQDISKLVSSAGLVLAGGLLTSVLELVERIIIARALSVDAYGEVSLGIAVMTMGVTLGLAGFQQGIPRYMSRFDEERDIRGAWLTGLLIGVGLAVVFAGVIVFAGDTVVSLLFEGEAAGQLVLLFALAIPFQAGLAVGIGAVRGLENTIYKTIGNDFFYNGFRILTLIALLWLGLDVVAAGYAYVIAAAAGCVVMHLLFRKLLPLRGSYRLHTCEMVRFSAPLMLSTVIGLLLARTDTLMLGYFRSSAEVGIYNAAYPLATGMLVVLGSFGFMYLPVASRLDADDQREEVDAAYKLTTKWIYVLAFPIFLVLVAFPADVLTIIFGSEYVAGALALQILTIGFFANAAGGRNRETLAAFGFTEYVLLTNGVALVVNVVLNLALVPAYGVTGASVASAASFITMNAFVVGLLHWKFGVSPFSRPSTRTFLVLPAVLLPLGFALAEILTLSVLTLPVVALVACLATVYTAAVTGCLQAEDRIPLELVEEWTGLRLPLLSQFVPEREAADGGEVG